MRGPAPHSAEEASRKELGWASLRLCLMLVSLALLVVPLLRELPLGKTTRTGMLAWLLVALAFYWIYAGLGYRPLLLLQLLTFSTAATLLTTKAMLVLVGIDRLSILRRTARSLILVGAALAALNLGFMLLGLLRRRPPRPTLT
ncbi:MAG TPA: hypothetical protein VGA78_12100 [Gemmatimonadales bacterium]